MKIRTFLAGFLTFVGGCGVVYFMEPWIEGHIDSFFFTASAPSRMAGLGLLATFGITGYLSGRIAKTNELRWGLLWAVVTTAFVAGVSLWGSDAAQHRFALPRFEIGWSGAWLAFCCLLPVVCASAAQDTNRKRKADKTEEAAEVVADVVEAAETIHEIVKHH